MVSLERNGEILDSSALNAQSTPQLTVSDPELSLVSAYEIQERSVHAARLEESGRLQSRTSLWRGHSRSMEARSGVNLRTMDQRHGSAEGIDADHRG